MSNSPNAIRINDLQNPILTDYAKQYLTFAEKYPARLTADDVLETAQGNTGLANFGPSGFYSRLQRLLSAVSSNQDSTELGKYFSYQQFVNSAERRLFLYDVLQSHPEIEQADISAPIIIAGPGRSGTTSLQSLIAADNRMHSLRMRDTINPMWHSGRDDPAFAKSLDCYSPKLLPYLNLFHSYDKNDVAEDGILHSANFVGDEMMQEVDQFKFFKLFLKALQWRRGKGMWVLKSPTYYTQLVPLISTFPNSTIVIMHRDPVSIVQSAATAKAYTDRIYRHKVNVESALNNVVESLTNRLRKCLDDRKTLSSENILDISFQDFKKDPLGQLERVYTHSNVKVSHEFLQKLLKINKDENLRRRKYGKIRYDLRRDFSANPGQIRKHFEFYLREFPVDVEVE